ncbi:putative sulfate/molybdate transporter [Gemmatimonas sp.]|uniref:putative sulfate/molybdate transporter n=1 Tax=Gemmatimonas sp. TaxID=1962908 RepID=UPI0027B96F94|nr:putative sulfate/molybdate transporter [Gemmatimonas sp.]
MNHPTPHPLSFTRHEFAGAFGDLGTDLPLLVGVVLATGMDAPAAFVAFGGLQILSGFAYRLPMPVQPLKAMAAIAIAGKIAPPLLAAGGLIVGVTMLLLANTGALEWIARTVPKPVVRGIQVGLGIQLLTLALTRFLPAGGPSGWLLAATALGIIAAMRRNRRVPAGLVVLTLGLGYAAITWPVDTAGPWGFHLPSLPDRWPTADEFSSAALLLALPQIALSLGNSVLATRQVVADFFPERQPLTVQRIGTTYGLMNLVAAPLGGLPVCHGSGGIVGHYVFGARTGGSAIIYGSALLVAGLFLVGDPAAFQRLVPGPVLGVLLFVEALAVLALVRDQWPARTAFALAIGCGLTAAYAPYGYALALIGGTLLSLILRRSREISVSP